jgi:hypothetical protein
MRFCSFEDIRIMDDLELLALLNSGTPEPLV